MNKLIRKIKETYIPFFNEQPLMMIKCVKSDCMIERPFTYSASFDHYCEKCREDYNKLWAKFKEGSENRK